MVGRKPKAKVRKPTAHLPIELYTVSYSPQFPRGAKREIRDDDGKLLFSARQMRIRDSRVFTKDQIENVIKALVTVGYQNVEAVQQKIDLPSKCPACKREGTPAITIDKRQDLKEKKNRLNYNHTSSPKTCYVGTVNFEGMTQIKLKQGLPINSLGYANRVGEYPL